VSLPQIPAQANPELLFNGDAYESTFEEEWMSRFEFGGADTAAASMNHEMNAWSI
jgi:hypothetical protein